jgi:hypothetical protein
MRTCLTGTYLCVGWEPNWEAIYSHTRAMCAKSCHWAWLNGSEWSPLWSKQTDSNLVACEQDDSRNIKWRAGPLSWAKTPHQIVWMASCSQFGKIQCSCSRSQPPSQSDKKCLNLKGPAAPLTPFLRDFTSFPPPLAPGRLTINPITRGLCTPAGSFRY